MRPVFKKCSNPEQTKSKIGGDQIGPDRQRRSGNDHQHECRARQMQGPGQPDLPVPMQRSPNFTTQEKDLTDQRRNELLTDTEIDFLDSELEPETV